MPGKRTMGKPMRALGLMSGTSMDGIDVALLETDGEAEVERGPALTTFHTRMRHASSCGRRWRTPGIRDRRERPGMLPVAERALTELHAAAVAAFLRKTAVAHEPRRDRLPRPHRTAPPRGSPQRPDRRRPVARGLAQVDVVYDLRAADLAAGGQGAPLVPVYHRALLGNRPERPIAVLNIGGVANVTFIGRNGALIAFDTGPGNALLDDYMAARTGQPYDRQWRRGRAWPCRRGAGASAHFAPLLQGPAAEVARPARVHACGYRMHGRAGPRARPSVARGRRGDPRRLHGLGGGARPRALPGGAAALDRERRRPAQSHADAHDRRARPECRRPRSRLSVSTATAWRRKPGPTSPFALARGWRSPSRHHRSGAADPWWRAWPRLLAWATSTRPPPARSRTTFVSARVRRAVSRSPPCRAYRPACGNGRSGKARCR